MPHTYAIDDEESIINVVFTGETTVDELKATVLEIARDPGYNPHYHMLSDLRLCDVTLTHADLTDFTRLFGEEFGSLTGKSAILLGTPHATALAMLHQEQVTDARTTDLFVTPEAAFAWLKGY